jgi:methylation protein EvaC
VTIECRVCGLPLKSFMSFGQMPIANGFLTPDQFADEYFFELEPASCESCGTFQIMVQPDPERIFHGSYAFFSRTSRRMVAHFAEYAEWVRQQYLSEDDPFVVEIGSNDGIMLENFARAGIRHVGIEPSANVAKEARRHGVDTKVAFFGSTLAEEVADARGKADALLAANVICHIPDLNGVAAGADRLLQPDGVLIFEEPYLGDMIEKTAYDQIYDEHVFIFSARSVANIFGRHGFELIDVKPQWTHGGSMRYVLARQGCRPVSAAVPQQLNWENARGLDRAETLDRFRANCERSREALVDLLVDMKRKGRRVAGYGATSKSTTVLNYCRIGPELVEFISDTTPIKQGKFTPGTHIPICPYEAFIANYPNIAVLFAWNHKAEIMEKEGRFAAAGGRWITFVPDVTIS